MITLRLGPVVAAAILSVAGPVSAAPSPIGNWVFEDGESAVEFHVCGDAVCGRFSWFKQDHHADGSRLVDSKNADPALHSRPLCGLDFITGLKPREDGSWSGGKLYSPGGGSFYDIDLNKVEAARITERAYKGIRMLGKSFTLTRASADLPRCRP